MAFTQGVETRHRYQKISKNEAVKRTRDRASSSPAVFLLLLGRSRLILTRAACTDTYSTAQVQVHTRSEYQSASALLTKTRENKPLTIKL